MFETMWCLYISHFVTMMLVHPVISQCDKSGTILRVQDMARGETIVEKHGLWICLQEWCPCMPDQTSTRKMLLAIAGEIR